MCVVNRGMKFLVEGKTVHYILKLTTRKEHSCRHLPHIFTFSRPNAGLAGRARLRCSLLPRGKHVEALSREELAPNHTRVRTHGDSLIRSEVKRMMSSIRLPLALGQSGELGNNGVPASRSLILCRLGRLPC